MSGEQIRIDADVIQQHASKGEQLASDAAEAVSAIGSINLSGGAFGVLCAWMVPPVAVVSTAVSQAISGGQDLISRTASEVRAVVSDFDSYEQAVIEAVQGMEKVFEG